MINVTKHVLIEGMVNKITIVKGITNSYIFEVYGNNKLETDDEHDVWQLTYLSRPSWLSDKLIREVKQDHNFYLCASCYSNTAAMYKSHGHAVIDSTLSLYSLFFEHSKLRAKRIVDINKLVDCNYIDNIIFKLKSKFIEATKKVFLPI